MTNDELNAAVAVEVMGWTLADRPGYGWPLPNSTVPAMKYRDFCGNIAHAWSVVEKMLSMHWAYAIENAAGDEQGRAHSGGGHSVWFAQYDEESRNEITKTTSSLVIDASVPRAICLAALSAVRAKTQDLK